MLGSIILIIVVGLILLLAFPFPIGPFLWGLVGLIALNDGIQSIRSTFQVDKRQTAGPKPVVKPSSAPRALGAVTAQPTAAEKSFTFNIPEDIPTNLKCPACGANIGPTTRKCAYCGSILQPVVDLPDPVHLAKLEIDGGLRLRLPGGEKDYRITGRALIAELWQATSGPNIPWTPTGNLFAGFALQGVQAAYLLNWQNRFYLFDNHQAIDDQHIQRYFLPYARTFGQSGQMGQVNFDYQGRPWRMVDIGRSRVIFTEGQGLHIQRGAEARFIYAQSPDQASQMLVEDYRAGGAAQDTLWHGYRIEEQDIIA